MRYAASHMALKIIHRKSNRSDSSGNAPVSGIVRASFAGICWNIPLRIECLEEAGGRVRREITSWTGILVCYILV